MGIAFYDTATLVTDSGWCSINRALSIALAAPAAQGKLEARPSVSVRGAAASGMAARGATAASPDAQRTPGHGGGSRDGPPTGPRARAGIMIRLPLPVTAFDSKPPLPAAAWPASPTVTVSGPGHGTGMQCAHHGAPADPKGGEPGNWSSVVVPLMSEDRAQAGCDSAYDLRRSSIHVNRVHPKKRREQWRLHCVVESQWLPVPDM